MNYTKHLFNNNVATVKEMAQILSLLKEKKTVVKIP